MLHVQREDMGLLVAFAHPNLVCAKYSKCRTLGREFPTDVLIEAAAGVLTQEFCRMAKLADRLMISLIWRPATE